MESLPSKVPFAARRECRDSRAAKHTAGLLLRPLASELELSSLNIWSFLPTTTLSISATYTIDLQDEWRMEY